MRTLHQAEVDEHVRSIQDHGFSVIEEVMTGREVDQVLRNLDRLEAQLNIGPDGTWYGGKRTIRIPNLLEHGETYRRMASHEGIIAIVTALLGDEPLISAMGSAILEPGERPQPIHAEDMFIPMAKPHQPMVCSTMWSVSDFTEENGGTRIVPGSHRAASNPSPLGRHQSTFISMSAGSVLAFDGALWHGGGRNTTSSRRYGVSAIYCAGYLRQQDNLPLMLSPDTVRGFDVELQKLAGFGTFRGRLGNVYGRPATDLLERAQSGESGDVPPVYHGLARGQSPFPTRKSSRVGSLEGGPTT